MIRTTSLMILTVSLLMATACSTVLPGERGLVFVRRVLIKSR